MRLESSNAIRLLLVLPATRDDMVRYEMRTWTTADGGFSALSYMWGPDTDDQYITLNDAPFRVGRNLYYFLWLANYHFAKASGLTQYV